MAKLDVQGENQSPIYKFLTTHSDFRGPIKWNFEKYLVNKSGKVVGRFDPEIEPDDKTLIKEIWFFDKNSGIEHLELS
jgi:glutathione peroxidase